MKAALGGASRWVPPKALLAAVLTLSVACSESDPASVPVTPESRWILAEPASCPTADAEPDALDTLLDALDVESAGIERARFERYGGRIASDPARMPFVYEIQASPGALTCFGGNLALRSDLSAASEHPRLSLIADAIAVMGLDVGVGGAWPALDAGEPLGDALSRAGAVLDSTALRALSALPRRADAALARLVVGALEAVAHRDEALGPWLAGAMPERLFDEAAEAWLGWDYADPEAAPTFDPGTETAPYERHPEGAGRFYGGALRLVQALDEARLDAAIASDAVPGDFELFAETHHGFVLVRGADPHTYDPALDARLEAPAFLIVDIGGDDTYRIPAGSTVAPTHAVSVHVDLGGDDLYTYARAAGEPLPEGAPPADEDGRHAGTAPFSLSRTGRQGSGRLGYGLLFDLGAGNDRYESLRMSQGFAALGVGVLWDDGGNDEYSAESGSQATALGGVALLYDGGGDDTYRAFTMAQSFAGVSSNALLYELSGSDRYELVVDSPVLFGSLQTAGRVNLSLGQGTGMGYRNDRTGQHLGGGLALLRDAAGDDEYVGGTFAQGTGYWMGSGFLADADGRDAYDAVFYGQGVAAHFAAAALLEGGGDDRYNLVRTPEQSSLGLGHDNSLAVMVDDAGSDRYRGPDWSLGASTCRGVGVFVDNAGDDEYRPLGARSLGAAGAVCDDQQAPAYGFFVDAGGRDAYTERGQDDAFWMDAAAVGKGGGLDQSGAITLIRAYGAAYSAGAP